MNYNNTWLQNQLNNNQEIEYTFFWGHRPGKDGKVTKSCFSQWYDSPFEHDGIVYKTAEHWMMAEKARLFKDVEFTKLIIASDTPKDAKTLGRRVKNFNDEIWLANRERIVLNGSYLKFTQHKSLWNFLDSTENKIIVEASPYDKIWGIGMKESDQGVRDPRNWKGDNLLGYALMEVRDKIRSEKA